MSNFYYVDLDNSELKGIQKLKLVKRAGRCFKIHSSYFLPDPCLEMSHSPPPACPHSQLTCGGRW